MFNELNIYKTFQNIFDKSKVIDGRFSIAIGYGSDLNDEKVGEFIVDKLKPKKYPLVALFPPIELPKEKGSEFKLKLIFALQQGEGSFGIKDILSNNTSGHPVIFDWKDMSECARNFLDILKKVSKITPRNFDVKANMIERFSYTGIHQLSGVALTLDLNVLEIVCNNTEYNVSGLEALKTLISNENLHTQHKH